MKYYKVADYSQLKTLEVLTMVIANCDNNNLPRPHATVTKDSYGYCIACLDADADIMEKQLKYIYGLE